MTKLSLNDIKFDLLKIIAPWDGRLERSNSKPVRNLFNAYLGDLQRDRIIYDYSIDTTDRGNAFTFDVNIKMSMHRTPKKLKIHVGKFTHPWIKKETA